MSDVKLLMTDEEQTIWRATYASAFAAENSRIRNSNYYARAEDMTAEFAIGVADQAVHRLRQWRSIENPDAGRFISEYWKEK